MITLDEFLAAAGSQLNDAMDASTPDIPGVILPVIILGATDSELQFSHLGIVFSASRSDVLSVDPSVPAIPNPFGKGTACLLVLHPDAKVVRTITLEARQLVENAPFVIARPSLIPQNTPSESGELQAELSWLQARGLSLPTGDMNTYATTYTNTQSSQFTGTRSSTTSNGMSDDTSVDDSQSDSMGRDDANADDVSAAPTIVPQSTTYTGTQSSEFTGTRSSTSTNGMSDDTSVDDSNSDSLGRDDANVDDVNP